MTEELKAKVSAVMWRSAPMRFRPRTRAISLIGPLLVLTVGVSVAHAQQWQPDWWEEISPAGSVMITATGVSRSEAHERLAHLGLTAGAVPDLDLSVYGDDAFHGVQEAKADWAVARLALNGRYASRLFTEVLAQSMTVTAVISSDGLLITDDSGEFRIETYRRFPMATCVHWPDGDCNDRVSFDTARDDYGTIVEFIREPSGFPSAVRFGETLVLRYNFAPPLPERPSQVLPEDTWREPSSWDLVDLRTSEIVTDSVDAGKVASERKVLSVTFRDVGEILRFEDGEPFVVVRGIRLAPHALLPLGPTSEVWRTVYVNGDGTRMYGFRVDYTDSLVRVEIGTGELGRSVVVEAPRSLESAVPVSFAHPEEDLLTDSMRSGVRLRTTEPMDRWLQSRFEKARLPIIVSPFHHRGIGIEESIELGSGRIGETARMEHELQFGPAEGCEAKVRGILCLGGDSEVIGEESPYPW